MTGECDSRLKNKKNGGNVKSAEAPSLLSPCGVLGISDLTTKIEELTAASARLNTEIKNLEK